MSKSIAQQVIQLIQGGQLCEATAIVDQAVERERDSLSAEDYLAIGFLRSKVGNDAEAVDSYRRASILLPSSPVPFGNLAAVFCKVGAYAEAEDAARRSLALASDRPESWHNLGNALAGQQKWREAAEAYEKAIQYKPDWVECQHAAAQSWDRAGEFKRAGGLYKSALQLAEAQERTDLMGELWNAIAYLQARHYQYAAAEQSYRHAAHYRPDDLAIQVDLANTLKAQFKLDEALTLYQAVAAKIPNSGPNLSNIGTVYQAMGQYDEAVKCFEKAAALTPQCAEVWSNLATCLNYSPNHTPAQVKAALQQFEHYIAQPAMARPVYHPCGDTHRPLRVGYVSPDFRKHAVAYFALQLIEGHTAEVEVYCYYNHRQHDDWTARFKAKAKSWVDCVNMDDAALAERIGNDRIDILVDLAGPTEGHRLLVFARRPAPIQVTWLGYVTTTGLSSMDWRVTHADVDPEGSETDYTERLYRLSGTMWCWRPLPDMPEVSSAPCLAKGMVTFGDFNRYSKVSDRVLGCWSEILSQVPSSRLLMNVPEGSIRERIGRFFHDRGIAPERIVGYANLPHAQFWALHHEVDIALDPFPFGGGTTSYETLWMGVPLVTCTGGDGSFPPRFSSRLGSHLLKCVGLSELVAATEEEYVAKAVALAMNPERVGEIRQMLRQRMAASPLMDSGRFVKEFEAGYRAMWRQRCAAQTPQTMLASALVAHQNNDLSAARQAYEAVLLSDPLNYQAGCNLGAILRQAGETEAAIRQLGETAEHHPEEADVFYNFGNALSDAGRLDEAIAAFDKALSIKPNAPGALFNLGIVLARKGDSARAEAVYRQTLEQAPDYYDAALNLGALMESQGRLGGAIAAYRQATEIAPDRAAAWNNLGLAQQHAGRISDAITTLHRAFGLEPIDRVASNILMCLQYHPDVSEDFLTASAKTFGQRFKPASLPPVDRSVNRKLRIGYVSADLLAHPVGLLLKEVFACHDRDKFEVYCYANQARADDITTMLQQNASWRWVAQLNDDALYQCIRNDEIDVLVDLSGHTSGNRLPVFGRRAAPLQISWLGYFATTGLPAMDAVIMDPYHAPPWADQLFAERVVRLPDTRFCYWPVPFAPEVVSPPCLTKGYVTFGSFNNTAKLNKRVIEVWAEILRQVPESRLVLKYRSFADAEYREDLLRQFADLGVNNGRIELRGQSVHGELLQQYADIDIALDPFPFSGGYTSCEALWMGLPIVTLPGRRPVSRQSLCFLANIGLVDLVASDESGYVAKAVHLANNPEGLARLRQELRDRMRSSALMTAAEFTRNYEAAINALWRE